jgi:hypothetical protein
LQFRSALGCFKPKALASLGEGELPGGRLQIGDSIGQFHWRYGFAQAKACAIRVGEGTCVLRIFVNNNKRWQLLTAAMNGAQQCNPMTSFTESDDSDI